MGIAARKGGFVIWAEENPHPNVAKTARLGWGTLEAILRAIG